MRQMPSVTEITVPSVRFSAATWRFWIFYLISSLISEGLICICLLLDRYRVSAAAIWPRASRTEAWMTWSPTCTRAPPSSSGSTSSSASTFLP